MGRSTKTCWPLVHSTLVPKSWAASSPTPSTAEGRTVRRVWGMTAPVLGGGGAVTFHVGDGHHRRSVVAGVLDAQVGVEAGAGGALGEVEGGEGGDGLGERAVGVIGDAEVVGGLPGPCSYSLSPETESGPGFQALRPPARSAAACLSSCVTILSGSRPCVPGCSASRGGDAATWPRAFRPTALARKLADA